jgi:hypothetical protein
MPLLRLTAETLYTGGAGAPRDYSEGLDAAVSCHDYPQLYDMAASPADRRVQYGDAVRRQRQADARLYAPFTIGEYLSSEWEAADWCLGWPTAPPGHPAGPPGPPSGRYPDVPTLVLSGELDSITSAAEGSLVAGQFPQATQVIVANSFHVTAVGDTDHCAVRIVRRFLLQPHRGLTADLLSCAHRVPPVRAVADYHRTFHATAAARPTHGTHPPAVTMRAAATAVNAAADLIDRWYGNYSGSGHGLYGGTWSYSGDRTVRFRLRNVRLTRDLAISGRLSWSRYGHGVRADLTVRQTSGRGRSVASREVDGSLHATWDSRARAARAQISGTLGGWRVRASMPAP